MRAIINPTAGFRSAPLGWPDIKRMVHDVTHDVVYTESQGHATSLAAEAVASGVEGIIVVGGDGTVNEVIQSVAGKDVIIAPIMAGTGSDFMRSLGSPGAPEVVSALTSGIFTKIDSAIIESNTFKRRFINIMEVGFGAEVMRYVNSHRRNRFSFYAGILGSIWKLTSYEIELLYNGLHDDAEAIEIVVANGRYFGGGMLASPASSLTDGKLD
ncbi:MAG: diacylglycerol kinase family protein, partial [Thermoplasmataceae archaeon]